MYVCRYCNQAQELRPPQPSPVMTRYNGHDTLGVVSEALEQLVDNYYDSCYSARDSKHRVYSKEQVRDTEFISVFTNGSMPGKAFNRSVIG